MRITSNLLTVWVLAAALLCGCRTDDGGSALIVTASGLEISRAEFDRFLSLKIGELNNAELSDSIRSNMLDEYIQRRLVLNEASRANLAVTDAEIEQAAFQDPQIKSTASTEDSRRELANELLIAKYYHQIVLKDVQVSPEEVQKYLEENKSRLVDRPAFMYERYGSRPGRRRNA
jgi:hypothetical protein